jgi:glyoxylase-like metal-dependent hydrolase (beta-lactamase superfamily II)
LRPKSHNPFATPRSPCEVVPGVTLLGSRRINFYAVAEGRSITLIDCGFYGHLRYLESWLGACGRRLCDIEAVVITHGDGDHVGFASVFGPLGIPVYVPQPDLAEAQARQRVPVRKILRNLWRPACLGLALESHFDSASIQPAADNAVGYEPGAVLDLPGRPQTVHVPGHSPGNCSVYLPRRGVLIGGDSLMTVNIFTGKTGVWAFSPHDRKQDEASLANLTRLRPYAEAALLPGHGEPWLQAGAVGQALDRVRVG